MLPFKRVRPALGTYFEITLKNLSANEAYTLSTMAFCEVERLEKIFNRFDTSSEIYHLNKSPLNKKMKLSSELARVLNFGFEVEMSSSRAFRLQPQCLHQKCYKLNDDFITRFSCCQFDLGGIAKGYIVDHIFEMLTTQSPHAEILINAGGDLRCHGEIDIRLKVPSLGEEKDFALTNFKGALATSSLIDTGTKVGKPSARYNVLGAELLDNEAATVTVGASSCMAADALTKVLLLGSTSALLKNFPGTFSLSFNRLGISL